MQSIENLQFSQTSLQEFIECHRRFYLRYIENIKWPGIRFEPALEFEKFTIEGSMLHQSIHQYFIGISVDRISHSLIGSQLELWWQNFINFKNNSPALSNNEYQKFPEYVLIGRINQFKLVAKYDLVVVLPDDKVIIFDWKTNHKQPDRKWLLNRIQTKLYPVLLLMSGQHLARNELKPENITMIYWFANQPGREVIIEYSDSQFRRDIEDLGKTLSLIQQLSNDLEEDSFKLTENKRKCMYCEYRSLCNTGIQAGTTQEFSENEIEDLSFDLEQISEVQF